MKYAITGHTLGIGKAIYEKLQGDIIGFSRSTGYDITNFEDRKKIIYESKDCDVFINNAHCEFGQTLLLIDLFNEWRDLENKTIINVGSRAGDPQTFFSRNKSYLLKYQAQKIALREMSSKCIGKCKIKYISFGYVATEKILQRFSGENVDMLDLNVAVDKIISLI